MTNTPSSDTAASTSGTTGQGPSNLPATGGETTNSAAMLLALGVVALLVGGALTFARRPR
jgi:LPXTG-motif cell wall-anchored protein